MEGLSKQYSGTLAVDQLSFTVSKGEILGLLGPNGAGKTTTIKILCGLLKADAGSINLAGKSLSAHYQQLKGRIGLCPQDIVIWEKLTCYEQLKFSGVSYGLSFRRAGQRAKNLLETFALADKRNALAGTLSGGMQRRLNIALALVHDPELVILDEPQAGLDPQSKILVRDLIRELAKDKAVILTTHDMDEADKLSNRVAVIDHGKILAMDTPDRLKEQSGPEEMIQVRKRTLEDVFIAMTGRGLRE